MRKTIAAVALAVALTRPALAHVQNERSLYEDIQFSTAQKEIVYLRGISAISAPESGAQLFRPEAKLSRETLAFWAGVFKASPQERAAKPEDIRKAAIEKKLVSSLDGEATYGDVNQAYFGGALKLEKPAETMTHEQFVTFLGGYLERNADGPTLFQMAGATKGPTGPVEKAEQRKVAHDGEEAEMYFMTLGGKEFQVAHHPKMLHGPTDLALWQGKTVEDSWLLGEGHSQVIAIAAVAPGAFSDEQLAGGHGDGNAKHGAEEPAGFDYASLALPAAGAAALIAIGAWLLRRSRVT